MPLGALPSLLIWLLKLLNLAPQTIKLGHLGLCLFSVLLIHSLFFFFFFARFHVSNINLLYNLQLALCDVLLDYQNSLNLGYNSLLNIFQGFLLKPRGRYLSCHKIVASFVSLQYPVVYFVRNKCGGRGQEGRGEKLSRTKHVFLFQPNPALSVLDSQNSSDVLPGKKSVCSGFVPGLQDHHSRKWNKNIIPWHNREHKKIEKLEGADFK